MKKSAAAILLLSALALAACSSPDSSDQGNAGAATPAPNFSQFSDLPIPPDAKEDVGHTSLYGQGDSWVGRLALYQTFTGNGGPANLYDFFMARMPSYGWQEVTALRGSVSTQTWMRGGRVATIQIQSAKCVFSECADTGATITVTPVSQGGSPAGGGMDNGAAPPPPPPPMPETPPAVESQPLQ